MTARIRCRWLGFMYRSTSITGAVCGWMGEQTQDKTHVVGHGQETSNVCVCVCKLAGFGRRERGDAPTSLASWRKRGTVCRVTRCVCLNWVIEWLLREVGHVLYYIVGRLPLFYTHKGTSIHPCARSITLRVSEPSSERMASNHSTGTNSTRVFFCFCLVLVWAVVLLL